jgi:signal transduction histidine kinase/CheY-like chemotaxis protein
MNKLSEDGRSKRTLIRMTSVLSMLISFFIIVGVPSVYYFLNSNYNKGLLESIAVCHKTMSASAHAQSSIDSSVISCIQHAPHPEKFTYTALGDEQNSQHFIHSIIDRFMFDSIAIDQRRVALPVFDDVNFFVLIVLLALWVGFWSHILIKILPLRAVEESVSIVKKYVEENFQYKKEKELAEEMVRVRTLFLAKMSHEIRTPLNGVIGMIDLAVQSDSTEEKNAHIHVAKKSAESLISIVNDILDFSKVDEGKLVLCQQVFDLSVMLSDLSDMFRVEANQKDIVLHFKVSHDVPQFVVSDIARMRQILINLIGNAIKFTDDGEVSVSVAFHQPDQLSVTVSDTGIGIAKHKLESIFSPFFQAEASISRMYGGTGLGLTITQQLVQLLGGSIHVESEEHKGTSFLVRLTVIPAQQSLETISVEEGLVPNDLQDLRILVAEDNAINMKIVATLLKNKGAIVSLAVNGKKAVELMSDDIDFVLMDVEMPVMSGIEATQAMRAKGFSQPIYAFTAHAVEEIKSQCLASGMNGFLTKPLIPNVLLKAISDAVLIDRRH